MNLSKYNFFLFFIYLFLATYNFVFYFTYQEDKCFVDKLSSGNSTDTSLTTVKEESSLQLTQVPVGIGLLYVIMSAFSIFTSIGVYYFSQMLPEKFAKLGFFKGALGCFVRNNPKIMRVIHYVIIILILVQFILIYGTDDCKDAVHVSNTIVTIGEMWNESITFNIVTVIFWIVLHCLLPFWRKNLSQEAFIYEPYDSEKGICRYLICDLFGPN